MVLTLGHLAMLGDCGYDPYTGESVCGGLGASSSVPEACQNPGNWANILVSGRCYTYCKSNPDVRHEIDLEFCGGEESFRLVDLLTSKDTIVKGVPNYLFTAAGVFLIWSRMRT